MLCSPVSIVRQYLCGVRPCPWCFLFGRDGVFSLFTMNILGKKVLVSSRTPPSFSGAAMVEHESMLLTARSGNPGNNTSPGHV